MPIKLIVNLYLDMKQNRSAMRRKPLVPDFLRVRLLLAQFLKCANHLTGKIVSPSQLFGFFAKTISLNKLFKKWEIHGQVKLERKF